MQNCLLHQREARGVSVGSTCLLSVCQAITISPRNSRWGQLKMKAPKYTGSAIFLCWVVHMLINILFTRYVKDHWSNRNITRKKDLGLCYGVIHNRIKVLLSVGWFLLPAVSCLVSWSGSAAPWFSSCTGPSKGCNICIGPASLQDPPPNLELPRASWSWWPSLCLCTVSPPCFTFVWLFLTIPAGGWWLVTSAAPITAYFPTVSPYILMSHGCRVPRLSFSWIKMK